MFDLAFLDRGGGRLFVSEGGAADTASILYVRVGDIHAMQRTLEARGVAFRGAPRMIHRQADGTDERMVFLTDREDRSSTLTAQVHTTRLERDGRVCMPEGMFGPHRLASRALTVIIAALPLTGCYHDPAPSDFDPQPPASPTWSGDRCPDLDGLVVDLAGDPLATALAERAAGIARTAHAAGDPPRRDPSGTVVGGAPRGPARLRARPA